MRNYVMVLTLLVTFCAADCYAQTPANTAVLNSFQRSFDVAKNVNWSHVRDLDRADFTIDDQKLVAFFGLEGNIVATSRPVTVLQIPMSLSADLKKNFANFTVFSVFELNDENGTSYYVDVKNPQKFYTLRSTMSGEWIIYKK